MKTKTTEATGSSPINKPAPHLTSLPDIFNFPLLAPWRLLPTLPEALSAVLPIPIQISTMG